MYFFRQKFQDKVQKARTFSCLCGIFTNFAFRKLKAIWVLQKL